MLNKQDLKVIVIAVMASVISVQINSFVELLKSRFPSSGKMAKERIVKFSTAMYSLTPTGKRIDEARQNVDDCLRTIEELQRMTLPSSQAKN